MKRKIVSINEELCNGCELCVQACHEGAIAMVNGRAQLISDSYCDGLGDCLPACPTGAIQIVEREAEPFDEEAVQQRMQALEDEKRPPAVGCPGMQSLALSQTAAEPKEVAEHNGSPFRPSQLRQWPVQLHLLPVAADYLTGADLLLAADCTAFACGGFHEQYMKGKVTAIACPKLDDSSGYVDKLAQILAAQNIRSLTVLRMVVPCCGGITQLAREAVALSGTSLEVQEVVLELDGREKSRQ